MKGGGGRDIVGARGGYECRECGGNEIRGGEEVEIFGQRVGIVRCANIAGIIFTLLLRSIVASVGKEARARDPAAPRILFHFFIAAAGVVIAIMRLLGSIRPVFWLRK